VTTLAAAATDPLAILSGYGALGAFAILLVIYAQSTIKRDRERTERAEQQVTDLNAFIRTELLPRQVASTLLHQQVAETLAEAIEIIAEVKAIERNERRRGNP
jgi:hypothetical protein